VSGALTIAGGAMQANTAQKQKEQAEALRKQTRDMQVEQMVPQYMQVFRGRKALALAGLPGMDQYEAMLEQNLAANLKAIRENSPRGGSTVNAISQIFEQQNAANTELAARNDAYKAGLNKEALADLWNMGDKQRELELNLQGRQAEGYRQANALEAAGTANTQTGINTITGAIGSTATALTKNAEGNSNAMWKKYLDDMMATGGGYNTPSAPTYSPGQEITLPAYKASDYMWDYSFGGTPSYVNAPTIQ
jgi:hypothetical protein